MTTLELAFPPSTNNIFINTSRGRIRSQRYADWSQEAGWQLKQQRPPKIKGPVILKIELGLTDKRRKDASNFIKAVEDLLVEHEVIEADDWSIVTEVRAKWNPSISGVRVTIERVETMTVPVTREAALG